MWFLQDSTKEILEIMFNFIKLAVLQVDLQSAGSRAVCRLKSLVYVRTLSLSTLSTVLTSKIKL